MSGSEHRRRSARAARTLGGPAGHRPTTYDAFVGLVQRSGKLSPEEAEGAVQATLRTLAERISAGEARDLAAQLPPEVGELLADGSKAEKFDLEEFLRRVSEREGVDLDQAESHARAVFDALGRTVTHDELRDMASELPKEFAPLVASAQPPPRDQPERPAGVPADEFFERVAARAGLDRSAAARTTEAVLEVLGERISGGQADDLADQLPRELYQPLLVGKIRSHGSARPMSLEQFVDAVAEREGVRPADAQEHCAGGAGHPARGGQRQGIRRHPRTAPRRISRAARARQVTGAVA
jgi:uncharacterized protein (DUF2267 family)